MVMAFFNFSYKIETTGDILLRENSQGQDDDDIPNSILL